MIEALGIPEGTIFSTGWRTTGQTAPVATPTGTPLFEVGVAAPEDVDAAARSARAAQPAWGDVPGSERARVMLRTADLLAERWDDLAALLVHEAGATVKRAQAELGRARAELEHSARLAEEVTHRRLPQADGSVSVASRAPVGVVGVISPWNAPLVLCLRSVAPALALGNAVLHKPDLRTPAIGGLVVAGLLADAGLPTDLLHVLPGGPETGEALVSHPDVPVISFTGSTAVGRQVGETAGRLLKRACLELGGNNAFIVLDDADVQAAADAGARGTFAHSGQICMATGRHLVHASVYDEYLDALTARAAGLRLGDPADGDTDLGPLIDAEQAARVARLIERSRVSGMRVLAGGEVNGPFVEPTVVADVGPGVPLYDEEVFGPVAAVTPFASPDELHDLVARSDYQLSAAIWSGDVQRGWRLADRVSAGCVHVNGATVRNDPDAPFGAFGLSGNGAYFGGPANLETFTKWRWTTAPAGPPVGQQVGR